jgi:hypothetical protein
MYDNITNYRNRHLFMILKFVSSTSFFFSFFVLTESVVWYKIQRHSFDSVNM